MNFLEQLAAEWYEYSDYFVRTNVKARRRSAGGWDSELDVLAYKPSSKLLLHIEISGDAESWAQRKKRFVSKKFVFSKSEYEWILGSSIDQIRKIAIVGWSRIPQAELNWGDDIEVITVPKFLAEIMNTLRGKDFMSEAVPEGFPILRTVQMVLKYGVSSA